MPDTPRFVLVTGLSGAGKSQALHILEDLGYFCIDNLPPALVPKLAELVVMPDQTQPKVAVCVDARTGQDLTALPTHLEAIAELGLRPDTVFLDCSDEVLLKRYSETRRRHPSAVEGDIMAGIQLERGLLSPIRARADLVVDTTGMPLTDLREQLAAAFSAGKEERQLFVTILSFGFKFGLPPEADMVMDIRFLPNPFYEEELRNATGNDPAVRDYVLENDAAKEFVRRTEELLRFLLPQYVAEPKSYLTVAIGCTGGKHRSVAMAHEVARFLRELDYEVRLRHRDIARQ